jgi:hypothetical protein
MNNNAVINRIAHQTGYSRKVVLDTLKTFGMLPGANKQINRNRDGK